MSHSPTGPTPPSIPGPIPALSDRTILGHPPGLFLLFLVEMWERFSYYGMRGLLVLYLISVVAVHQLKPGTYTNIVEFVELKQVDKKDQVAAATAQTFEIRVGQPPGASATQPAPNTGEPVLRWQRLTPTPDPEKPGKTIWTPSSESPNPIVLTGQGKGSFDNTEVRFRVSNPSDAPVKCRIEVKRAGENPRTFFTVNDDPGSVTTEIKPDKVLGPKDEPYDVRVEANTHDSGRNWLEGAASLLYGWYTGLAYLFPILGGIIADKLIGTHRSMLIGGVLIAVGHIILGLSGIGDLAQNQTGLTLFFMGLAVIVLGTGHFKPNVSVMVGQLYAPGDPRRDGAFTIFYMGINLGAFLCAFVCGTLGQTVGWHWGFASAAVGMLLGLGLYLVGKPIYLRGIGDAPKPPAVATRTAGVFFVCALAVAAAFAGLYHIGAIGALGRGMEYIANDKLLRVVVPGVLAAAVLGWCTWFVSIQRREDRGPVVSIFLFMAFNAFFWIAFEQAGSSVNVFTEQDTDRYIGTFEVPATWFQSVNAGLIFIMAPIFAALWTGLGKRRLNPSQPLKIAFGLIFLGIGYIFMVWAGLITKGGAAKASMLLVILMYFWHTVGELCLSPTGLSYVTKAAPAKFVSLLMGIWFVSSFIANLGGGLVASQVEAIEKGEVRLPWQKIEALNFGGKADFFFLFVVTSIGVGLLVLVTTPLLKKLLRSPTD